MCVCVCVWFSLFDVLWATLMRNSFHRDKITEVKGRNTRAQRSRWNECRPILWQLLYRSLLSWDESPALYIYSAERSRTYTNCRTRTQPIRAVGQAIMTQQICSVNQRALYFDIGLSAALQASLSDDHSVSWQGQHTQTLISLNVSWISLDSLLYLKILQDTLIRMKSKAKEKSKVQA